MSEINIDRVIKRFIESKYPSEDITIDIHDSVINYGSFPYDSEMSEKIGTIFSHAFSVYEKYKFLA